MSRRPQMRWLGRLLLLAGMLMLVMLPTAAMAQEDQYPTASTTQVTTQCLAGNGSEVCGTAVTVPRGGSSLPFTGGNVAMLTVLGLAAAAAGVGLVWVGKRSDSAA